jgi:hypothetical protein
VNNLYSGPPVLGSRGPYTTSRMGAAASSTTGPGDRQFDFQAGQEGSPGLKQNPAAREIHGAPLAGLQVSIAVDPLARFELQAMPFTRAAFASRSSLLPRRDIRRSLTMEPLIALAQFVLEIARRDTASQVPPRMKERHSVYPYGLLL